MGSSLRCFLTLLRARGADSGVLGDVDSLAVSDVELSEELLLDNSLLDGRLVANCRHEPRFNHKIHENHA